MQMRSASVLKDCLEMKMARAISLRSEATQTLAMERNEWPIRAKLNAILATQSARQPEGQPIRLLRAAARCPIRQSARPEASNCRLSSGGVHRSGVDKLPLSAAWWLMGMAFGPADLAFTNGAPRWPFTGFCRIQP